MGNVLVGQLFSSRYHYQWRKQAWRQRHVLLQITDLIRTRMRPRMRPRMQCNAMQVCRIDIYQWRHYGDWVWHQQSGAFNEAALQQSENIELSDDSQIQLTQRNRKQWKYVKWMAINGPICGKYGEICGKYGEKTPNNTTECHNQYILYYNATKPPHASQYNTRPLKVCHVACMIHWKRSCTTQSIKDQSVCKTCVFGFLCFLMCRVLQLKEICLSFLFALDL